MPYTAEEIEVEGEVIDIKQEEEKSKKEWKIKEIKEVINDELKAKLSELKYTTKQIEELFTEYDGDQEKILNSLK